MVHRCSSILGLKNKAESGIAYIKELWDVLATDRANGGDPFEFSQWCYKHQCQCVVDPSRNLHRDSLKGQPVRQLASQPKSYFQGFQWCVLVLSYSCSYTSWTGNIAGTTCVDWSAMGKALQHLGPSALPFVEWMFEVESNPQKHWLTV